MTHLIADSGGTKTSWILVEVDGQREFETQGINPMRDSEDDIARTLRSLPPFNATSLFIHFYGAGCMPPYSDTMHRVLQNIFPFARITVDSDMLGAAHALCGDREGIACILGTGSNSCLYDGKKIVSNVSPLGWILGDEGSGAVLGRKLVGNVLKGIFSAELCQAFAEETGFARIDIIDRVYRQPQPNRFLASLVPFLGRHRDSAEVHDFLVDNFRSFFSRNVANYGRRDLPVSFVGGIASNYTSELEEAARLEGFRLGRVLKRPIHGMADYLTNWNQQAE